MRKIFLTAIALPFLTLTIAQPSHAAKTGAATTGASTAGASKVGTTNKFGLGGMLGAPTGLSMKYFFTPKHAIDIGIGFGWFDHAALFVHVDYKFHIYLTKTNAFVFPLFFGVGPKLFIWFHDHCHSYWGSRDHCRDGYAGFGIRAPTGVAFHFIKVPLDVFLEIVPGVGFYPWPGFFLDGAAGVRYYF